MIRAMIFDLDGTIADTLPLCIAAFKKAIEPLAGRPFSDQDIIDTFGPSEEGTVRALVPKDVFTQGLQSYWRWYEELHDMCPLPFPGMCAVLEALRERGVFLGLVTGKAKVSADISLRRFGLESLFADAEYGWEHGPRKPDAIGAILSRNSLDPQSTFYVGDAPSDISASRAAGIGIIAAAWARTAEPERLLALEPDRMFTTITDFSGYVDELTLPGRDGRNV